jgi:hypothetical protein
LDKALIYYTFLFSACRDTDYDWLILPNFVPMERRYELASKIGLQPGHTSINKKNLVFSWPTLLSAYWETVEAQDKEGKPLVDAFGRPIWQSRGAIVRSYLWFARPCSEGQVEDLMLLVRQEIECNYSSPKERRIDRSTRKKIA